MIYFCNKVNMRAMFFLISLASLTFLGRDSAPLMRNSKSLWRELCNNSRNSFSFFSFNSFDFIPLEIERKRKTHAFRFVIAIKF